MAGTRGIKTRMLTACLALSVAACGGRAPAPAPPPPPAAAATDTPSTTQTAGVTAEPCRGGHPERGCIYLGVVSDLVRGPFAERGAQMLAAQQAFWRRVNADGGIGGYDIDATTYVRDNAYDVSGHRRAFAEIRDHVLALAQSLGSPQTLAIVPDLRAHEIIAVPAGPSGAWASEEMLAALGASPCVELANVVDWLAERDGPPGSLLAIHFAGDYGDDAAAGARAAARRLGARFTAVTTRSGHQQQAAAVEAILSERPGVVTISTGPAELAAIVTQATARGYDGTIVGSSPAWDEELLRTPVAETLATRYVQALPWAPWNADTPGHRALRTALRDTAPSEAAVAGWVSQYPLRAAIALAASRGDVTPPTVTAALRSLRTVDAEGMLPPRAGEFADPPDAGPFRESVVALVDTAAPTGLRLERDFFGGPTLTSLDRTKPCRAPG